MIIETLSTFPTMFDSVMGQSMMKRAQDKGILDFTAYDLRDWTYDRHRTTDDEPYGGGHGLVMRCAPIFEAYEDIVGITPSEPRPESQAVEGKTGPAPKHANGMKPTTIFLSPVGRKFDDACANELAQKDRLLFVCGHYEGIDERAYSLADYTISLGDYVLTSGELASMVIIDAVVRKIPGVLGAQMGAELESFADGLLEHPQYTRPAIYRDMAVPEVLTSGNHKLIAQWQRQQSIQRTFELRPDLLDGVELSAEDIKFLQKLQSDAPIN